MDARAGLVVQPVILAAGKGKRILTEATEAGLGERPKVLYELNSKPLLDYVLRVVEEATSVLSDEVTLLKPIVVVGFMKDLVINFVGDRGVCVEQLPSPMGTGHAVLVTEPQVPASADAVLVLNGDMPAWHATTIAGLCRLFAAHRPTVALNTVIFTDEKYTADFFAYGRIIRKDGAPQRIVEQRDATEEERKVPECNPSLYCFDRQWVFQELKKLKNDNSQSEYYLTDLLEMALNEGLAIETVACRDWREALGVNTLEQLKLTEELITKQDAGSVGPGGDTQNI